MGKPGVDGKAVKRSSGGVRGGDDGNKWPGNLGGIRGFHTHSVARVVVEIVVGAGERGDGF